ncbi:hypothetical protein JCM8115_004563 [Rhodotorula mucilaginosa]
MAAPLSLLRGSEPDGLMKVEPGLRDGWFAHGGGDGLLGSLGDILSGSLLDGVSGNTLDTNSHNALNGPKLPPTRVSMNFGVSVDVGELPSSSLEGAAQDESAGQLGHDMDLSPEILDGPEEDGAIAFDLASLFPPPAVGDA